MGQQEESNVTTLEEEENDAKTKKLPFCCFILYYVSSRVPLCTTIVSTKSSFILEDKLKSHLKVIQNI
jgi:hypothetical protein